MSAGLDSLAVVELRNTLQAKFSVDLPATVTFDYPTAEALAAFVAQQLVGSKHQNLGLQCTGNLDLTLPLHARSMDKLISLEEVAALINKTAGDILGSQVEGKLYLQKSLCWHCVSQYLHRLLNDPSVCM